MQQSSATHSPMSELFTHPAIGAEGIEVARGATLYTQGATAEHLYYIHRGQIRLYQVGPDGEERLADILGPGQWFGCSSLSDQTQYVAQAVAATEAQLSRMAARNLLAHIATNPQAALAIIRQLATSVRTAREDAARLQFQDCNHRLVDAMLRFSSSAAATVQGSDIVLHLTHEQLAQAVGAARETVSLALTEMRHKNLVRTGRNRLIFNREELRASLNGHAVQPVA